MAGRLRAILITEPEGSIDRTLAVVNRALHGGVSAVLVRRPQDTARRIFGLTRQLRPLTRQLDRLLLVSDRVDVAVAADADGVHLGERSLPAAAARRVLKPGMLLGVSVHNLDEAGQAEDEGADYVFLGPLLPTFSHPGEEGIGLDHYREAVLRSRAPVLAIGGIDAENVKMIAEAGGRGAAAIRAFYDAADAADVARAFRAAFGP